MRLTIQFLPILIIFLLVPASLFYQVTFLKLLFLSLFLVVVRFLLVLVGVRGRRNDDRMILETISISHYVEKVRWAMDYLEIQYEEEENVGVVGLLLLGRKVPQLKIPGPGIFIENSSDILRYLFGKYFQNEAMADFLRPTKDTLKMEVKFDVLGEDLRRFIYFNLFNSGGNLKEMEEAFWGMFQPNIPAWQKYLLKLVSPISRRVVRKFLKVTREESRESMKNAQRVFDEMNEILSDGREFLMDTPTPTYIDFHLCSIAAPLLQPPNYSGGVCSSETKDFTKFTQEFLEEKEKLEKTLVGQYVLKTYSKFRINTITKTGKSV